MEESKSNNSLFIPGAIILAGVLIAGAIIYSNSRGLASPGNNPAAIGVSESVSAISSGDIADDDPFLGNPEAPVVMVEFSDFQCPFCRRLYTQTLPKLKDKYIKTGKVKLVYRDFPLIQIHDMAQKYAEAGECADEQGKFWLMHDKIFDEHNKRGFGTITDVVETDLKKWAREIGLEGEQFDECLDSGKYTSEVQKDYEDGQRLGITGTPATFINGRLIQGAIPYAQFEAIIDQELEKLEKTIK